MPGMRLAAILCLVSACATEVTPPSDGGQPLDERHERYCRDLHPLCVPIGEACTGSSGSICGGNTLGWCTEAGVCREQCSPVDYPRCSHGTEHHETDGNADVCYCE